MPFGRIERFLRHLRSRASYPVTRLERGAIISGESVLARNVRVERYASVHDTMVEESALIRAGCLLTSSKIGSGARIGLNASITNSSLGAFTIVHDACGIRNTTTEDHVAIWPRCICNDASIGAFSYIAPDALLQHTSLGRFCSIGPTLICGYGTHPTGFVATSPVFYATRTPCEVSLAGHDRYQGFEPITIGHDVWIGARVFVKDGVSIGNGAIVGAGAVVVKDVPDYAIVGGVPARIIRFRFSEDIIAQLLRIQWWNWDIERLRERWPWFAQDDMQLFLQKVMSDDDSG